MIENLEFQKGLYPYAEIIEWNQIFQGNIRRAIHPAMIQGQGIAYASMCRKLGDTRKDESEIRIVIFNRDYAIKKMQSDLARLIENLDADEFEQFMNDVYYGE